MYIVYIQKGLPSPLTEFFSRNFHLHCATMSVCLSQMFYVESSFHSFSFFSFFPGIFLVFCPSSTNYVYLNITNTFECFNSISFDVGFTKRHYAIPFRNFVSFKDEQQWKRCKEKPKESEKKSAFFILIIITTESRFEMFKIWMEIAWVVLWYLVFGIIVISRSEQTVHWTTC